MSLFLRLRLRVLRSVFRTLDRLRPETDRPAHLQTGDRGEEEAFFHLRSKGYVVIARGWHLHKAPGDLDLVAWKNNILCFIEVKTRTSREVATAESAVDREKRQTLRRLARLYLRQYPEETTPPVQFDIVSVYLREGRAEEILHLPSAFGWNDLPAAERL